MAKDKQKARIKKGMKSDIEATLNTADILSGKKVIGSSKLNSGKKVSDPFAEIDNPKNLNKFLNFMEKEYTSHKFIKVKLAKRKI